MRLSTLGPIHAALTFLSRVPLPLKASDLPAFLFKLDFTLVESRVTLPLKGACHKIEIG